MSVSNKTCIFADRKINVYIMALAVQGQTSGQLLVTLSDVSMMNSLKKAISLLKGVETVKPVRQHRLSAIEKSMQEVENGELYEAKNLDDLFRQLND